MKTVFGDLGTPCIFVEKLADVFIVESIGKYKGNVTTLIATVRLKAQRSDCVDEFLHICVCLWSITHCKLVQHLLLEVSQHVKILAGVRPTVQDLESFSGT